MSFELGADPDQAVGQPVTADRYRQVLSRFATGVTVVTTRVGESDCAMTATAFTSVSLEPPLVLVCVGKRARFHDAVLRSGWWAASILARGGERVSRELASRQRPVGEQLVDVDHTRGPSGCAVLSDAVAWVECQSWATYDGGDHTIVIGEVVGLGVADERDEKIAPLLHYRGEYRRFDNH